VRALVIPADPPSRVVYEPDYPLPRAGPGEVLIRVDLAGICATDLELARGYMRFAGVPGHEFVGTVVAGADELAGRRVVAEINCPCGQCGLCRRGLSNHCPTRTVLGIAGRDGAFAEYLAVPAGNCHVVPDSISDRQAVFVEPLAAAGHVLDACSIRHDTRVAVLGSGRLGLLVAQVLALEECRLEVIGRNRRTLAFCERRGIATVHIDQFAANIERSAAADPRYDTVVECMGSPEGLRLALKLCRPRGTIVLKSTYAEPAAIDLAPIAVNEVNVVGSRCGDFPRALSLLAGGRIEVEELIGAVYRLDRGVEALAAAARPENIKVLLKPGRA